MNRAAAALFVLAFVPSALAQNVAVDPVGYPLLAFPVVLEPSHEYEFRTDYELADPDWGANTADSVLTLWDISNEESVAGADGCSAHPSGSFEPAPSCFGYVVPPGSLGDYALLLRAKDQDSAGITALWFRDVTTGGPWMGFPSRTFGGAIIHSWVADGKRLTVRTTHLPGRNDYHEIWTLGTRGPWDVRFRSQGRPPSGTAMFDLPNASDYGLGSLQTHVFGGYVAGTHGAIRAIQAISDDPDMDFDRDGIDVYTEQQLGSCDNPGQTLHSGYPCSVLRECDRTPVTEVCRDALRDTDMDGLRDDLETFGFGDLDFPKWGADPGHMDLFIEVDAIDQDGDDSNGCQGFDPATVTTIGGSSLNSFDLAAVIFGAAPRWMNPDQRDGIELHFDVGIANPEPSDSRWGDFGGGNTCVDVGCSLNQAVNGSGSKPGCTTPAFADDRKWALFYLLDGAGGGGRNSNNSNVFAASEVASWAHELAHAALNHGGPVGSAGGIDDREANYRPHYPSRESYLYEWWGRTYDPFDLAAVSFSDGLLGPLSRREAPEVAPFPGADLAQLADLQPGVEYDSSSGEWNVDWNRDGEIRGRTFVSVWHDRDDLRGSSGIGRGPAFVDGPELAVVGSTLLLAYAPIETRYDSATLQVRVDTDVNCTRYPRMSGPRPAADPYPPCVTVGAPSEPLPEVQPDKFAMTSDHFESEEGGSSRGVLVWIKDESLQWGVIGVDAPTPPLGVPDTALITFEPFGDVPLDFRPSVEHDLELVELGPNEGVMLLVADEDGKVHQLWLPAGSDVWDGPVAAEWLSEEGGDPEHLFVPAAAASEGRLYAATLTPGEEGSTYTLYEFEPDGLPNGVWRPLASPRPFKVPAGKLELVRALDRDGDDMVFWVFAASAEDGFTYKAIDRVDEVDGPSPMRPKRTGDFHAAAVWDERVGPLTSDAHGVRFARFVDDTCNENSDCPVPESECVERRCTLGDAVTHDIEIFPFVRSLDPSVHGDYNDWVAMKWGFCDALATSYPWAAPSGTSRFNPTPYDDSGRCGPRPIYPEPGCEYDEEFVNPRDPRRRPEFIGPTSYSCISR